MHARNLIFHEFAHQLDAETGDSDVVPELETELAGRWTAVMEREYLKLESAVRNRTETFLDEYGAENRFEFFAVVTEAYFDEGTALKEAHPELFRVLKGYYRVDGSRLS